MAKKKRRKSQSKSKRTAPDAAVKSRKPNISRRAVSDEDFNPDYTPIIRDLKRIGILAAAFFVVLVVLSFIL